jgi:hypothetical protein
MFFFRPIFNLDKFLTNRPLLKLKAANIREDIRFRKKKKQPILMTTFVHPSDFIYVTGVRYTVKKKKKTYFKWVYDTV